jgi:hypothetical protein
MRLAAVASKRTGRASGSDSGKGIVIDGQLSAAGAPGGEATPTHDERVSSASSEPEAAASITTTKTGVRLAVQGIRAILAEEATQFEPKFYR